MPHVPTEEERAITSSHSYQTKEKIIFKSLVIDTIFWIPDIFLAVLSGSVTLYADVIKSGNEILSTFFAWLAMRKITKGTGDLYDYGVGKFETLTGIVTGVIMFLSLVLVFAITSFKLLNPSFLHEGGAILAIGMMFIGVCVNTWLWREKSHIANEEYSPVMESQVRLFKTKALTDLTVLIALILVMILAEYEWAIYIDPLASFIVIGSFLFSGYRTISSSLPDLLDKTIDEELQLEVVRALAAYFNDYEAFHGVRSRRSGNNIYIELFLEFDGEKKLSEVQDIINRIKITLETDIPRSSVTIMPSTGKYGAVNDKS